ncbi:MAG: hypothetical protein KDB10_13915 [Acidimicrobiales bacterium]|nr:hypothetical protein [Acidimicrobiales bacterium]MCB9372719.1 hypothetical protein [Microthrixaceae bacterium]
MRVTSSWAFRVLWVLLPVVAGPTLADGVDPRSAAVRLVASVALWAGWAAALVVSLVPSTVSLTALRTVAPLAPLATGWAVATAPGAAGPADALALLATTAAAVVAMAPGLGDQFVDGSSYGPERRFALRVPAPVVLGPLELTWALAVAGPLAGPLLLASGQWAAGAAVLVVGAPATWWAGRSLHALSRRWLVFVPGGVVLHDPLTVTESVLVPRARIAALGPAAADSTAYDLTQRAAGLALEVTLTEPLAVSLYTPRSRTPRTEAVGALLFTPTRPAHVLAAAEERHLPVG